MERQKLITCSIGWEEVEGYAYTIASRNVWKTSPVYSIEDLLQEAFFCYQTIFDQYHVEKVAHFMRLFGVSFYRRILHIADNVSARRLAEEEWIKEAKLWYEEDDILLGLVVEGGDGVFETVIKSLGINRDLDRTAVPLFTKYEDGSRETIHQWLEKISGLDIAIVTEIIETKIGVKV